MNYCKQSDETVKEYAVRLCTNKDVYNLTYSNIAELINKVSKEDKSESYYRRWWNGYKEGYDDGKSENSSLTDNILSEKMIELEEEIVKFRDYRNSYNAIIRDKSRSDTLHNIIKEEISKLNQYQFIEPFVFNDYNDIIETNNNDLIVCLNDIHYGAYINNAWNLYDSGISKFRMKEYYKRILNIKFKHLSKNCYVFCNGDLISGNIHPTIQISNKENVVEQIIGVSELISFFLLELSRVFENVYFSCVAGNHSRLSKKKDSPKDERLDELVPWYLETRLSDISNVFILNKNIDNTFNIVNIRGKNYLNVHGDYDNFSNIGNIISMVNDDVYCVHMGHKHKNVTDYWQKYKIIMSGSFQGVDDYCIQKRLYSEPQQLVCVCDESGITCTYDIVL